MDYNSNRAMEAEVNGENQYSQQLIPIFMPPNSDKIKIQIATNWKNKMVISVKKNITVRELQKIIAEKFYQTFLNSSEQVEEHNGHHHSSVQVPLKVEGIKYQDCTIPLNEIVEDIVEYNSLLTCVIAPLNKNDDKTLKRLNQLLHNQPQYINQHQAAVQNGQHQNGHNIQKGQQQTQQQQQQKGGLQSQNREKSQSAGNVQEALQQSQNQQSSSNNKKNKKKEKKNKNKQNQKVQQAQQAEQQQQAQQQQQQQQSQLQQQQPAQKKPEQKQQQHLKEPQHEIKQIQQVEIKRSGEQKQQAHQIQHSQQQQSSIKPQIPEPQKKLKKQENSSSSSSSSSDDDQNISDLFPSSAKKSPSLIPTSPKKIPLSSPSVEVNSKKIESTPKNQNQKQNENIQLKQKSDSDSESDSNSDSNTPIFQFNQDKKQSQNSQNLQKSGVATANSQKQTALNEKKDTNFQRKLTSSSSQSSDSEDEIGLDIFSDKPKKNTKQKPTNTNKKSPQFQSQPVAALNNSKNNGKQNTNTHGSPKNTSMSQDNKKNNSYADEDSFDLELFQDTKNAKKVPPKKKRTISFEANVYEEETSMDSSDESSEEITKKKKKKDDKFLTKLAKKID